MKKLALLRSIALAAAVACSTPLIAQQQEGGSRSRQSGDAQATQSQQADQADQTDRGGADRGAADRGAAGRGAADRGNAGRGSGTTQPGVNDTRQTGRTGTNTTTADAAAAGGLAASGQMDPQMELQKLFSGQLIEGNKAEVELGKLAQQRAENDQVKQFAQKMVTDHQNLTQKLTSLHQQPHSQTGNQNPQTSGNQTSRSVAQGGQLNQTGQSAQNRAATGDAQLHATHGGSMQGGDQTLQQLTSVLSQACENKLQMTKQMLEQHKGQEFDMAYMGQQVIAHTAMLAHLKALQDQNVGGQQFQQIVDQATQATQQHLEEAKNIVQQLKSQKT